MNQYEKLLARLHAITDGAGHRTHKKAKQHHNAHEVVEAHRPTKPHPPKKTHPKHPKGRHR